MTLTWNNSTDWATSALDESTRGDSLKNKGLTKFGKMVVARMNALGMMVDLSHVGVKSCIGVTDIQSGQRVSSMCHNSRKGQAR